MHVLPYPLAIALPKERKPCHGYDKTGRKNRYGVYTGIWEGSNFQALQSSKRGQLRFHHSVLVSWVPAATPGILRVLLVDDDPLVCDSVRRMLEFDQRSVQSVGSAAEALAVCEKEEFDLVILDYLMPVVKGDVLAKALKNRYPALPILMITADPEKLNGAAPL